MKKLNAFILICVLMAPYAKLFAQKDAGKTLKKSNDNNFVVIAADDQLFEIKAARLAKKSTSTDQVKELAKVIGTDHAKAGKELKKAARKKNIELPEKLSDKNQKKFDKLAKLKNAEFDKEYTVIMIRAHKDTLDLFQKEANKGSDEELKTWAAGKVDTLKHHLKLAKSTHDSVVAVK